VVAGGEGEEEVEAIYKLLHSTHLNLRIQQPKPSSEQFQLTYGVPNIVRVKFPLKEKEERKEGRKEGRRREEVFDSPCFQQSHKC
jgi:hypothetical protein